MSCFTVSISCQRLHDPRAPARTDGPLRATLPPRVSASSRAKPSFSPAQKAPTEWYQQDEEFLHSAVLVKFPCGQNKDTVKNVRFPPSLSRRGTLRSQAQERQRQCPSCVFQSKAACQQFLAANSGKDFLYTKENHLAARKFADVFVRQARAFEERQIGALLALLWSAANKLMTNHFKFTPRIIAAPVVVRTNASVCIVDRLSGFTIAHFQDCHGAWRPYFQSPRKSGTPWRLR